jgi:hypothetical protein
MAIIYTYPTATPQASDILLGTEKDATLRNPTKNFLISDIADYIIGTFGGTSLSVPIFLDETRPDGTIVTTLTDSIMTQDASPAGTTLTITGATVSTGQVTIPITPVNPTDAASKGYVDTLLSTFVFTQAVTANPWVVVHNLGKYPSVTVTDSNVTPRVVIAQVDYDNTNQVTITFAGAQAGNAYLN